MLNFDDDKDLHNSEHFALLVSHVKVPPPTYHFYRAVWDKLARLSVITGTMVLNRAVDDAVSNVTETIWNAANAAIPKTSNSTRKLCKP
ncbi:hypothetical protein TNCV_3064681 [Trichonephila clavipes]|nr:hypothetical protein TNCV_3064681 [Trichonephila clavipes]